MQKGWNARNLIRKPANARDTVSQNSDCAVPAAHNLSGLQAEMKHIVGLRMVKAAAHLPSNVEQIPDGKSLFAGEHGGDAIALDVFHGSAKLAVHFSRAIDRRNAGMAQSLYGFRLFQQALLEFAGALAKRGQLNSFQSDCLIGLRIVRLINSCRG